MSLLRIFLSCLIIGSFLFACENPKAEPKKNQELKLELKKSSDQFNEYWYQGLAEINSFDLQQARYGEIHRGEAILVFVTEDFLLEKQVKKESDTEEKAVSVLKMNFDRQFTTGIYDYSMMSSVFTPVTEHQWQGPIKTTISSQEWCGHSWTQFNQNAEGYHLEQHSYFEKEADLEKQLGAVKLEDGIWNQIRLNPDQIAEGKIDLVPSGQFLRFSHLEIKAYTAEITKGKYEADSLMGEDPQFIKINFPDIKRRIQIIYEAEYPHQILGWEENRPSGFGSGRNILKTKAKRKALIRSDYWSKNSVADSSLRNTLLLK